MSALDTLIIVERDTEVELAFVDIVTELYYSVECVDRVLSEVLAIHSHLIRESK